MLPTKKFRSRCLLPLFVAFTALASAGQSATAVAGSAPPGWICPDAKNLQAIKARPNHSKFNLPTPEEAAAYLFDQAKTESEEWLVTQAMKNLCGSAGGAYFPNSCELYAQFKDKPSELATATAVKQLKVDAEQLPSCHIFLAEVTKNSAIQVNDYTKLTRNDLAMTGYLATDQLTKFLAIKTEPTDTEYSDLVKSIAAAVNALAPGSIDVSDVTTLVTDAKQAVKDIDSKPFADKDPATVAAAVISVVGSSATASGNARTDIDSLLAAYTDIRAKSYGQAFTDVGPLVGCNSANSHSPDWCSLAGAVAQVAEAKNATEADATMKQLFARAMPWDAKLTTRLLSLDGMVGVQGGIERLSAPLASTAATYGAFAPIGLDLSLPVSHVCGAAGFFLSAVDLGAWISYSNKRTNAQGGLHLRHLQGLGEQPSLAGHLHLLHFSRFTFSIRCRCLANPRAAIHQPDGRHLADRQ